MFRDSATPTGLGEREQGKGLSVEEAKCHRKKGDMELMLID